MIKMDEPVNVLGEALQPCSTDPMTGFYRDGSCRTGPDDYGTHVVCAEMTADFLAFTQSRGNDLTTPRPMYDFPGLTPGDRWCLCVDRWKEALDADAEDLKAIEDLEKDLKRKGGKG